MNKITSISGVSQNYSRCPHRTEENSFPITTIEEHITSIVNDIGVDTKGASPGLGQQLTFRGHLTEQPSIRPVSDPDRAGHRDSPGLSSIGTGSGTVGTNHPIAASKPQIRGVQLLLRFSIETR